jgi:hypothetical protein
MKVLICIDDTDDIGTPGTGELADGIADAIRDAGYGDRGRVTRHQLYVHEDIPYTSHNSSMCFNVDLTVDPAVIVELASSYLRDHSAPASDPGLAVADPAAITDLDRLMTFSRQAKNTVLTKEQAYALASDLGIHLSEHGGTGQGIIGALAGIGLRMTGNDGRFRGKLSMGDADQCTIAELIAHPKIDEVRSTDGTLPELSDTVFVAGKLKVVVLDHRAVCLVQRSEEPGSTWRILKQKEFRHY